MSERQGQTETYKSVCYIVALASIVFSLSFLLFRVEAVREFSDIVAHIKFVGIWLHGGSFFSYTILQPIIYALSLGSPKIDDWIYVTIFLLSFLVAIKSLILFYILKDDGLNNIQSFIMACALMFVTPVINWWNWPSIYLGQFSATIWHSPTSILNIPFTILLFYFSMKALKSFEIKHFILVSLLIFLCGITKPNYLLAFIPVFLLVICYQFLIKNHSLKSKKQFIAILAITIIPVLFLAIYEYINLFNGSDGSAIIIAPLLVWSQYTPSIPLSLLVSLAFPIFFTIIYFHQMRNNPKVIFSWLVFVVAIFQAALFAEAGPRFTHGNFLWGGDISIFILFLSCTGCFMKQPIDKKWLSVMIIFLLHVVSGIFYYLKILNGNGYL